MKSSLEAYRLLEQIADEAIRDANFPTHFSVILKLKAILADPEVSFKSVVEVLHGEPLVSAKVIAAANSAANRQERVADIEAAVFRLGVSAVRQIAVSVVMAQLNRSKEILVYSGLSRTIWLHSLYLSAACAVIAKESTRFNPDEAAYVGLTLNLGAFYMLYRASSESGCCLTQADVKEGVSRNYLQVTKKLVTFLGLPEAVSEGIVIDEVKTDPIKHPPKTMAEILVVAKQLADETFSWTEALDKDPVEKPFIDMVTAIEAKYAEIKLRYR